MEHQDAMDHLLKDGNLLVPCSRYGRNTLECAEVAYQVSLIVSEETGSFIDFAMLDSDMEMVVNDSQEVEDLLRSSRYVLEDYGLEPAYNGISESIAEDMTDEYLDEQNDDVVISGLTYSPSRVLRVCDPIAYREIMLGLMDSYGYEVR